MTKSEMRKAKSEKRKAKSEKRRAKAKKSVSEEIVEEQEIFAFTYEGTEYQTQLSRKFKERKPYSPPNPKKVFAFIPGTIIDIFVKTNVKVSKGDKLLSLQAMKMNNEIIAPIDGIIRKAHVKIGDVVIKNQLLVEFR